MIKSRTKIFLRKIIGSITILGILVSFFLNNRKDNLHDILFVVLYQNGMSLYFQPIVYLIVFAEILKIRKIRDVIEIRNKTDFILKKLIYLLIIEWLVFWLCILIPYCILNIKDLFQLGNPILACLILLLHMGMMLLVMIIMISAYEAAYPYMVLFFGLAAAYCYHFVIEISHILPKYSIIFDPIYRAIHQIYF